jgi:hypothetical protein
MRAILSIRREKQLTKIGEWHSGKRMPRTAFPLSRSHSYILGSAFDWCVCEASCNEHQYRILVGFDATKAQYRGWLGLVCGHDQALLARIEYHPTHHGWHCHLKLGDIDKVVRGVVKEAADHEKCRICPVDHQFGVTQLDALNIAFRAFNVVGSPAASEGELFQ